MTDKLTANDIRALFSSLEDYLNDVSFERSREIELILATLLSRQHMFMLGPPGVAKSYILDELSSCIGARFFKKLFSAMTELSEVVGPIDIKAFEAESVFRFNYKGMLPEAELFIGDEIFKANSVMLNALLKLMNEREFDNGGQQVKTPLISAFGASNELPEEPTSNPFYDRFLVRCQVDGIRDPSNFVRFAQGEHVAAKKAWIEGKDGKLKPQIPISAVHEAIEMVSKVQVTQEFAQRLAKLREGFMMKHGDIYVSDRRWGQAIQFVKACAWLGGRDKLVANDVFFMRDCLWTEPSQRTPVLNTIAQHCDNALSDFQSTLNDIQATISRALTASTWSTMIDYQNALAALEKRMLAMIEQEPDLGNYCRSTIQQIKASKRAMAELAITLKHKVK